MLYGVKGRKHHTDYDPFWDRFGVVPPVELYDEYTMARLESSGREDGTVRDMRQIVIYDNDGRAHPVPISDKMIENSDLLKVELQKFDFNNVKSIILHADDEERQELIDLIQKLKLFRYEAPTWVDPPVPQVLNAMLLTLITDEYMRAVAKIAFHYFLKHYPRYTGSEPQFDEIREFIRTGSNIQPGDDIDRFVRLMPEPMCMSHATGWLPGWRGHILAAGMDYLSFCVWLQFFVIPEVKIITPTYEVFLGRNPSPIHYKEMHAHRFVYFENGKQGGYDGYMEETVQVPLLLSVS